MCVYMCVCVCTALASAKLEWKRLKCIHINIHIHIYIYTYIYVCIYIYDKITSSASVLWCQALISLVRCCSVGTRPIRLGLWVGSRNFYHGGDRLNYVSLLQNNVIFTKDTYNFIDPTNQSRPIVVIFTHDLLRERYMYILCLYVCMYL